MRSNKYNGKANFLGEIISERRKELKMSQNKLASNMQIFGVNIGKNDISKIESGNRLIKDFELIAIKEILNLDINSIKLK